MFRWPHHRNLATSEYNHPVGHFHVARPLGVDEDGCLALEFLDHRHEFLVALEIEMRSRIVEQIERCRLHEGTGQNNSLLHVVRDLLQDLAIEARFKSVEVLLQVGQQAKFTGDLDQTFVGSTRIRHQQVLFYRAVKEVEIVGCIANGGAPFCGIQLTHIQTVKQD